MVTSSALSGVLDGATVSIYLVLMFILSWVMGVLALLLGVAQVVVLLLTRRRYQRLTAESLQAQAASQSYLAQMLAGIETLKASGSDHRGSEHWSNLFVREINVSVKRGRLSARGDAVLRARKGGSPLLLR